MSVVSTLKTDRPVDLKSKPKVEQSVSVQLKSAESAEKSNLTVAQPKPKLS